MNKKELINYLDDYLKNSDFEDSSKNWLQVDSEKNEIKKIWYCVDSSTYIFDKAIEEKVDMVLSHHWLFWWKEEILTWINYNRIKKLFDNNICLYSSHLPLDAHPEIWNNIWLLKAFVNIFGLQEGEYEIEEFWKYNWKYVWFWLKFKNEIHISNIVTPYAEQMQLIKKLYNFWNKEYIKNIAFTSWWWWKQIIQESFDKWFDVYINWELSHWEFTFAKELWQSILVWWHYETEKIWPKLLAYHLKEKFGIEIVVLDEKY